VDATAPTLAGAEIEGANVGAVFSEAITSPSGDYAAGFSLTFEGEGAEVTITSALHPTPTTINFQLDMESDAAAVVLMNYDAGAGDIRDAAGNPLESFFNHPVTNNN
jgi:hypothetical protein